MPAIEVQAKITEIQTILRPFVLEADIHILEKTLETFGGKVLHSNHYLLIPLWRQLHKLYQVSGLSDIQNLQKNKAIVTKLLNVLDVLDVGYSRARG